MAGDDLRKPEGAEHGTGVALRRLAGAVQAPRAEPAPRPERRPVSDVEPVEGPGAEEQDEDSTGGYDDAVFAPSDRPDEPITHGAPFGPGANFVALPYEDEFAFRRRVADELESSGPASLGPYIEKLRTGG